MDWLPIILDPFVVSAWCALTGEAGRSVMGLIGVGGLVAAVGSLYTLPPAATDSVIITARNKQRRYRRWTLVIGWIAVAFLIVSAILYFNVTSFLRQFGKVCELSEVSHDISNAIAYFLILAALALAFSLWLRIRIVHLKKL
jgi:hypothetical protein